ncbi:tetratricopeptide repeat protein [Sporolactobacillus vineae]|uniref:tetratricopeptide repeat protein n=1 Tax=Sporolactobacillus vineae TaxID=444463 RepID=UPI000288E830|nr:tetratricopeptide repeat protein [Sporolactobacillus vineae]
MKKREKKPVPGNKIILFPDLEARLLDKATGLVTEKKYKEARSLFGKMLELDRENMKGLYGWAVCSVELGDYSLAEEAVRQLLSINTPYYNDVFRLYLTILIEKKDYRQALSEIRRASGRKGLPPESRAFLRQMKKFCELRLREPSRETGNRAEPEQTASRADWKRLEAADPKQQLLLIHDVGDRLTKRDLPQVEAFLLDERQNPEIKTMLLCAVREKQLAGQIDVRKFGKVYHVVFDSEFLHKGFTDRVERQIRQVLNSQNPTLADLAVDMERFFMMTVYPKPMVPSSVSVWAAAFSAQAAHAGQMSEQAEDMPELFDVRTDAFEAACREIAAVTDDEIR